MVAIILELVYNFDLIFNLIITPTKLDRKPLNSDGTLNRFSMTTRNKRRKTASSPSTFQEDFKIAFY